MAEKDYEEVVRGVYKVGDKFYAVGKSLDLSCAVEGLVNVVQPGQEVVELSQEAIVGLESYLDVRDLYDAAAIPLDDDSSPL